MSKNEKDYGTKMYEAVMKQKMSNDARMSFEQNKEKLIRQYNTINVERQKQSNVKRADYSNILDLSIYKGGYDK